MDYSDWLERNENGLREGYIDYINQSKAHDIYEYVFWWDGGDEGILRQAKAERAQFENWCQAQFEKACADNSDSEDLAGADR